MNRPTTIALTVALIGGTALGGSAVASGSAFAAPRDGSAVHHDLNHTDLHHTDPHHGPSRAQQEQLAADWVQLWNGDYQLAKQIIAPDVRVHAALMDGGDGSAFHGPAGMLDFIKQIRGAFPDLHFAVDVGPMIDGDHVVVRWIATGTYGGGFPGATAPVGTKVKFTGTDTLAARHGQIHEYWLNADTLLLIGQLKVVAG